MQRDMRPAGEGHGVVPRVAAHEVHDRADVRPGERVGQPEGKDVGIPLGGAVRVRAVQHYVRQAHRDRLALLDLAMDPDLNPGGHLDGAAVQIEEAQPVPASLGAQRAGLGRHLYTLGDQPLRQGIHVRLAGRAEGDQIQPLQRILAQPDDVALRRALGSEKSDAGILGDLRQAPDFGVKSQLLLIVRDRQVHMAQVSDQPRIYGHDPEH